MLLCIILGARVRGREYLDRGGKQRVWFRGLPLRFKGSFGQEILIDSIENANAQCH